MRCRVCLDVWMEDEGRTENTISIYFINITTSSATESMACFSRTLYGVVEGTVHVHVCLVKRGFP